MKEICAPKAKMNHVEMKIAHRPLAAAAVPVISLDPVVSDTQIRVGNGDFII
jgi:hypothetical protein